MAGENAPQYRTVEADWERMADALERIAAALEAANANDPLAAIERAMAEKDTDNPKPPEWMTR